MPWSRRAWWGALLTALLIGSTASAPAAVVPLGYDVSYPLCGLGLPGGAAFGIVGVNGGLANNASPCLATEIAWAAATPGLTSPAQPPVSLYLNTADPGNRVPDWPTPATGTVPGSTPYGACDGSWSQACAYLYGAERAAYSYQLVAAVDPALGPSGLPWWLDIETQSTWAKPTDLPGWAAVNVATIKGFVDGLRVSGATGKIGFYSTRLQWLAITGLDATSSPSQFAPTYPDWIAGTGSLAAAQANCPASFSGAPVKLVQYTAGGLDGDYACVPPVNAGLRIVSHTLRAGSLRLTGTISPSYRGRVVVDLTASYRGRPLDLRKSAVVVGGRWQVVLALPRHGTLRSGLAVAQSSPALGLLAGKTQARVKVSP